MRWKNEPEPEQYNQQVIRRFLFIPMRLGNETRWLEITYIQQYYFNGRWIWSQWRDDK